MNKALHEFKIKKILAITFLLFSVYALNSFAASNDLTVIGRSDKEGQRLSIDDISTIYTPLADNPSPTVTLSPPPANEVPETEINEVIVPPPESLESPPLNPVEQESDDNESGFFDFDFLKSDKEKRLAEEEKKTKEEQKKLEEAGRKALYWEKVRADRKKKQAEENDKKPAEQIIKEEPKGDDGISNPKRKPQLNYRNYRLPTEINKERYSKKNQHLPTVVYSDQYKELLFDSAASGNLDILRATVKRLGTTEIFDVKGNNALMYAVMAGNISSVRSLLGMDAAIDIFNHAGVAPLHMAAMSGRVDMVKLLLRSGASVDIMDVNYMTPLMLAAQKNHVRIAQILLKKDAYIHAYTNKGQTSLHIAGAYNSADVAYLLLLKGADTEKTDEDNYTPLITAAISGSSDVVNVLLKAGANTMVGDSLGKTVAKMALKRGHPDTAQLIESAVIKRKIIAEKIKKIRVKRWSRDLLSPNPRSKPDDKKTPFPIHKPSK